MIATIHFNNYQADSDAIIEKRFYPNDLNYLAAYFKDSTEDYQDSVELIFYLLPAIFFCDQRLKLSSAVIAIIIFRLCGQKNSVFILSFHLFSTF